MSKTVLSNALQSFSGKTILVNVTAIITIPYVFKELEISMYENRFAFGEADSESYPFEIWYDLLKSPTYDDEFGILSYELDDGSGFVTKIEMLCME